MSHKIESVQTGVRMEKRLLKGMTLHCFEGKAPFGEKTLAKIHLLKTVYDLDLTVDDSHQLEESDANHF